ncbi:MAG: hypothetical protein D6741_19235 [Planctomycetota bacterium]|nr:MAG: hypothetical protein D6741_19235 [Planctomycetota bacterium]
MMIGGVSLCAGEAPVVTDEPATITTAPVATAGCASCAGEAVTVGAVGECPTCSAGGCCGKHCRGCCHRYAAYIASFGQFNCACKGSYKFPVFPQYTYHWPGMYAQRTMTEYQSPYRAPGLKLPPWMPVVQTPEAKANAMGLPPSLQGLPLDMEGDGSP